MKDIIYNLRKFHGKIHEERVNCSCRIKLKEYLKHPSGIKAYILGTPVYSNIGDSAILLAQLNFLYNAGWSIERIKEVTFDEYYRYRDIIQKIIRKNYPIFGMGGGNMGNQWQCEEKFRYDVLDDFSNNSIVIFPQTIYFLPNSNEDELKSVLYYDRREKLTIVAREKKSLSIMKAIYPNTNILYTPDIVLSASMEIFGVKEQERKDILFCIRNDVEKSVDDDVWTELERIISDFGKKCKKTDMYSDCPITKENRKECVRKKMQEFCQAELVITDRLHGMIFAAITGTPCIVFSNYNHKVKGTYEWISYLSYIKYVETIEQAKKEIPELLTMETCKFNNEPLKPYFDKLAKIVRTSVC